MPTFSTARRIFWIATSASCFVVSWFMVTTSLAADPKPISQRFIPAQGLVAYVEYDGLDAHTEAWKATAANAMLTMTPAGEMMSELVKQVIDRLLQYEPEIKVTGADLLALQHHLIHRGFVMALHGPPDGPETLTLILNGVGQKPGATDSKGCSASCSPRRETPSFRNRLGFGAEMCFKS